MGSRASDYHMRAVLLRACTPLGHDPDLKGEQQRAPMCPSGQPDQVNAAQRMLVSLNR